MMEEVNVQYSRVNSLLKMHQAEIIEEGAQIGEVAVKLGEAYQPKQHFALTDELKFPFKLQQAFIDKYRQEACKQKINAGLFGQLADGKLNILLSKFDKEEHSFIQGILAAAQLAGGFSSGKYERIYQKTYSGALTQMEQKLKAVFDPQFILNR
jgi:glycolate oxidase